MQGVAGLTLGPMGRPCPTCNRTIAPLDGVNQWAMLSLGAPSARTEVLLGLASTTCIRKPTPCLVPGEGAIRIGKWKLIHGHLGGFTGAVPDPCAARSGHGQAAGKTFPLPIPANESAPICVFGWNPPPRADGQYELPRWPKDLDCDSLPCAMPPNSTYLSGRTMLFGEHGRSQVSLFAGLRCSHRRRCVQQISRVIRTSTTMWPPRIPPSWRS